MKELEDDSDGTGGPYGSGGAGADYDGGRSFQNMNKSQLARPRTGQENAWGVLHDTPTENARVYHP